MSEHKILLGTNTTRDDVAEFFSRLDDKQRVRARKSDDGIELYVRGSSRWHLFTDSLRSARDVRKDYEAAKQHLLQIVFSPDHATLKNPRLPFAQNLQNQTRLHKHDFRANHFKDFFNSAAAQNNTIAREAQSQAQNRIDLAWKDGNIAATDKTLDQQTIEKLIQGSVETTSPEYAKIQQQAGEFSKFLRHQNNPHNDREEIDYVSVENFAFSWKRISEKSTSKASAETENSEEVSLKKITSKITEQSIPERLHLNAGPIGQSAADLIIVDPQSNYQGYINMLMTPTSTSESHPITSKNGNESVCFSLRDRQKTGQTNSAGVGNNTLDIDYDAGFPTESGPLRELYGKVGEAIAKKISSRDQHSNDKFTVHMSILNPPNNRLASDTTSVALKAFVDATQQWLKNYPNLHVKLQLPPGISEQDMLQIYRYSRA